MGAIVDLIQAQGMAAGQIYGYVPDPPWGPPHQCPGCQPRPDKQAHAAKWDEWHVCEKKLIALGETSSCPVVRGDKMPEPYTNEERTARGGTPTQRMSPCVPMQPEPPEMVPLDVAAAVAVDAEQAQQKPEAKPRKAPQAPKGQGSLF